MTPQRRDFYYPNKLTSTRPHSDLLDDFRTMSKSMALPELPESEESDSLVRAIHVMLNCTKHKLIRQCRVMFYLLILLIITPLYVNLSRKKGAYIM